MAGTAMPQLTLLVLKGVEPVLVLYKFFMEIDEGVGVRYRHFGGQ